MKLDHAAEALICIDAAHARKVGELEPDLMLQAQVHATLALVEQQRIANIIAFGHQKREELMYQGNLDEIEGWLNDGGGFAGYLSKRQKASLGVLDA